MKSILYIAAFVFLCALCSCNNQSDKEQKTDADSSSSEVVNEDMGAIAEAFPDIYHFFSASDSSFSPEKFIERSKDTMASEHESAVGPVIQEYFPYFIFNTDSSFAIDLYSYNFLFVTKNGKTAVEEAGPDTEVGLVDMENKTRRRVYFGGTAASVLDAQWVNNRVFLLLTGERRGENQFIPSITIFDIPNNRMKQFDYDDTLRVDISKYRDRRIGLE
jgi:hypothetical protein